MKTNKSSPVSIVMGSDSDFEFMKEAALALKELSIDFSMEIVSAHRTPNKLQRYASEARKNGIRVIIAGAGGAAHLPGMIAAHTELPVIGVPVPIGNLKGEDALLSIVQMPKGVPVACVAIGNSWNAGILAAQILGISDPKILNRIRTYKDQLEISVNKKKLPKM